MPIYGHLLLFIFFMNTKNITKTFLDSHSLVPHDHIQMTIYGHGGPGIVNKKICW